MGQVIDFKKSKRAGKAIAKVCTHLNTQFDRLNRQLVCADCGRTHKLPAPKVYTDEKLAAIKEILSQGAS